MLSIEDRKALRLWFDAYDPAVDVEVTSDEVVIRSTRPRRTDSVGCSRRTADLQQDLSSALRQLVERIS